MAYFRITNEQEEAFLSMLREVGYMTVGQARAYCKTLFDWSDYTFNDRLRANCTARKVILAHDDKFVKFRYLTKKYEYPNKAMLHTVNLALDYLTDEAACKSVRRVSDDEINLISGGVEYSFINISSARLENKLNHYVKRYDALRKKLLASGKYTLDDECLKDIDGVYVFVFSSDVNKVVAQKALDVIAKDIPHAGVFITNESLDENFAYDYTDNLSLLKAAV